MSDLRPNPFCGHEVIRDVVADDQHRDICCAVECDLDMLFRMSDADWNARPIEDALRAENERLREALRLAAKHAERCHPESGVVHFGVDSGVAEWQRDMVVVRAALAGQEKKEASRG